MRKRLTKFSRISECGALQNRVNLVDLVKSFQTSIYLQNSASTQPRASLSKFAKNEQKVRITVRKNIGRGARAKDHLLAGLGRGEEVPPHRQRRQLPARLDPGRRPLGEAGQARRLQWGTPKGTNE